MNLDKVCPEDFFWCCFYLNPEVQLPLFVTRPPCGVELTEGPIPYGNILISLGVALLTINPKASSFMLYFLQHAHLLLRPQIHRIADT